MARGNSSFQKGNNLQTVLIGGVDSQQKPKTFVQLLYKDVPWGDTAEVQTFSDFNNNNSQYLV